MRRQGERLLVLGSMFITAFIIWTFLIQKIDVQPIGANGTSVGFATVNGWFHNLTGVHMKMYHITDWLGLVPIAVCMFFAALGFSQLIKRKSLFKVDYDMIILGIYYVIVILSYLIFEMIPINYRPILIDGFLEASYPSSTTLLVLGVMPTLSEQLNRRHKNAFVNVFIICFSTFMVLGRLISGVHWLTDIIGSILLSTGIFCIYKAVILLWKKKKTQ
jgi:undecaprenyl-diphosphatase